MKRLSMALALMLWFVGVFGAMAEQDRWNETVARSTVYCGGSEAVLQNVQIAADSINDFTLAPGDVFSFNELVGPREPECGYVEAQNGRGVTVVGGGVARVASAVWLAVKGIPAISITGKSTYGKDYVQSYVSSSADAIATDYDAGLDFAFRYTGEGYLTIYTWLDDDVLHCAVLQSM